MLGDPVIVGLVAAIVAAVVGGGFLLVRRTARPSDVARTTARPAPVRKEDASSPASVAPPSLDALYGADPTFSIPALHDFLLVLYRASSRASVSGDWGGLEPFVAARVRSALMDARKGIEEIGDIAVGTLDVRLRSLEPMPTLAVTFAGLREDRVGATTGAVRFEDEWTLVRAASAQSPPPEALRRLACPSCLADVATDSMGRCRTCGVFVVDTCLAWRVTRAMCSKPGKVVPPPMAVWHRITTSPPDLVQPGLAAALVVYQQEHPEFVLEEFFLLARELLSATLSACRTRQWLAVRPWCADTAFDDVRAHALRFEVNGLENVRENVVIERHALVKVAVDAFSATLVVRFWWTMNDFVVDAASGNVRDGRPDEVHASSRYLTFQRGNDDARVKAWDACPSCKAPLAAVDVAGVCTACGSWLAGGAHNWVLARIETPAGYSG